MADILDDLKKFQVAFHELVEAQTEYKATCESIEATHSAPLWKIPDETADKIDCARKKAESLANENERLTQEAQRKNSQVISERRKLNKRRIFHAIIVAFLVLMFVVVAVLWGKGKEEGSDAFIIFAVAIPGAVTWIFYFADEVIEIDFDFFIWNIFSAASFLYYVVLVFSYWGISMIIVALSFVGGGFCLFMAITTTIDGHGLVSEVRKINRSKETIIKCENISKNEAEYAQYATKYAHDADALSSAHGARRALARSNLLSELTDKSLHQLEKVESAMDTATELAKPAGLVSQKDWVLIDVIIELLETGRADTLKEALQLADTSTYRSQVLERFDQSLQLQGAQLQQLRANAARDAEHQREMLASAQATYEETIRTNNLNEYMNTILSDISYQTRRSNELQQESNKLLRG